MGVAKKNAKNTDTRAEHNLGALAEAVNIPVDEALFAYCTNLYSAAARAPVSGAAAVHTFGKSADNAMQRGMLAVVQELRKRGIDEGVRMSLTWRIMNLGDVLRERKRFARWLSIAPQTGAIEVSDALIRACATARISLLDGHNSFDFDHLEQLLTQRSVH